MTFGILTMATSADYLKAIGLALSARVSNPGVPLAIACLPAVRDKVSPHFDVVVDQDPKLRGFMHKIHLDRYSPFEETFFFDADVLLFRPLREVLDQWRAQPYAACGIYRTGGVSAFGFDRARLLKTLGKERMVQIDGAGHAYFRKPDCTRIFELAREIAADYPRYAGDARFADEDAMGIAMTLLDLKPIAHDQFWSRYCSGIRGTMDMDASAGRCSMRLVTTNHMQQPYMTHFAYREAPLAYTAQLLKLYRKFRIPRWSLLGLLARDQFDVAVKRRMKALARRLLRRDRRDSSARGWSRE